MLEKNSNIAQRFEEFGARISGSEHGWKKIFAEKLGVSPNQLTGLLSGRDAIGAKMQSRLRDLGADVDYILTGRSADSDSNKIYIRYELPAHLNRGDAAKLTQIVETLGKVSRNDTDAINKVITMIGVMFKEKEKSPPPVKIGESQRYDPKIHGSITEGVTYIAPKIRKNK